MQKPINRNADSRFITVQMAMERYNLCRSGVLNLAKECGGFIRYGRIIRIDSEKLDIYFSSEYAE